ncbi:MAG: TlpA family protein disulfide reductase [Armatimonadetes bacterium]|nr:TlpA family protein disulfide reductase [Armatimonadota bacterium]
MIKAHVRFFNKILVPMLLLSVLPLAASAQIPTGTKAPALWVTTLKGKVIKLSQLKGKVVLVDFWATWCPPCRMEIPHLQSLYKQNAKKGLIVLGVSVGDQNINAVKNFVQSNHLTYPVAYAPQEVAMRIGERFDFNAMPTTYIIDKKGIIRFSQVGYGSEEVPVLHHLIAKLLKEKIARR